MRAWTLFLDSIERGTSRRVYHRRPWLFDASQLGGAPSWLLAPWLWHASVSSDRSAQCDCLSKKNTQAEELAGRLKIRHPEFKERGLFVRFRCVGFPLAEVSYRIETISVRSPRVENSSMATLLGPLLAAMILAQASGRPPIAGEVVDDQGKPVANVRVVFYVRPSVSGKEYQAEAQARTDAGGQFRMNLPPLGRVFIGGISFLAYRPGSAITAKSYFPKPYRLVIAEARTADHPDRGPGRPADRRGADHPADLGRLQR